MAARRCSKKKESATHETATNGFRLDPGDAGGRRVALGSRASTRRCSSLGKQRTSEAVSRAMGLDAEICGSRISFVARTDRRKWAFECAIRGALGKCAVPSEGGGFERAPHVCFAKGRGRCSERHGVRGNFGRRSLVRHGEWPGWENVAVEWATRARFEAHSPAQMGKAHRTIQRKRSRGLEDERTKFREGMESRKWRVDFAGAWDSHEELPGPIYLQGSEKGHAAFRSLVLTPAEK